MYLYMSASIFYFTAILGFNMKNFYRNLSNVLFLGSIVKVGGNENYA